MGYIRKLAIGDSLRKLLNSRFCVQPINGIQEFILEQTSPSPGTPSSVGDSNILFLCPEKFMSGQCMGFEPGTYRSAVEHTTIGTTPSVKDIIVNMHTVQINS